LTALLLLAYWWQILYHNKPNGMPLVSRRKKIWTTTNRAGELRMVFCPNTGYCGQAYMGLSLDVVVGGVFIKESKHMLDALRGEVFGHVVVGV
jgi:gamma-glutamylcysteine synthetase